jgi:hypothetical protein
MRTNTRLGNVSQFRLVVVLVLVIEKLKIARFFDAI